MKPSSFLLALLVTALPAQAASVGVQADYSFWSDTYSASDNGGLPGHVGAVVQPAPFDGGIVNLADPFLAISVPPDTPLPKPVGLAHANGDAAGNIAVLASFQGPSGGPVDTLHAKTVWSETVINHSGVDQAYNFNFHIDPGGILAGTDAAGTWNGGGMRAQYNIQIKLDSNVIWNSAASLRVGKDGGTWHDELTLSGSELTRTYSDYLLYGDSLEHGGSQGYGGGAGYTFGGYDGLLSLGTLANNASFTISYLMEVSVAGPLVETGAYAAFGDPLYLTGNPLNPTGGMNVQVTPVPEPETYALLLAGLGLVGWASRRRD